MDTGAGVARTGVTAAILLIKTVDQHLRAAYIEGLRASMPPEAPYYTTKTCPFYPPRRTQLTVVPALFLRMFPVVLSSRA